MLVFGGDAAWRDWSLKVLEAVSDVWGGNGFVLVPYSSDGSIDPAVMEELRRYDPDRIAHFAAESATWLHLSPELITDRPDDARPVGETFIPRAASIAADTAHTVCSSMPGIFAEYWDSRFIMLRERGNPLPPELVLVDPISRPAAALVVRSEWDSDLALFGAFVTGRPALDEPSKAATAPAPTQLATWLLTRDNDDAPEELAWFAGMELALRTSDMDPWFDETRDGLSWYLEEAGTAPLTIAYGSSASDFALAVLLDRIHGDALWITDAMLSDEQTTSTIAQGVHRRLHRDQHERAAFITATDPDTVEAARQRILEPLRSFVDEDDLDRLISTRTPVVTEESRLLLNGEVGRRSSMPVIIDGDQTVTFARELEPDTPDSPERYLTGRGLPGWVVDVAIEQASMPTGRGADPDSLVRLDRQTWATVRASKTGISFDAGYTGYVAPGTLLHHRTARPRLRFLGLLPWVQGRAVTRQLTAQPSRPGQHAELIARRLGSRARLQAITASPMGALLREFLDDAVSEGGRTRLRRAERNESYFTFDALSQTGMMSDNGQLRDGLDELLDAGLLRRGLILNCGECGGVSFISVDNLGQRFLCPQCDAENSLTRQRWHASDTEPPFSYDLHPTWRTMLQHNGDLPLLLGNRLGRMRSAYVDISEIEFWDADHVKRHYEIDLIALCDGQLIVGETKSGPLGNGAQRREMIKKRLDAAEMLGANLIVFGTAEPDFSQTDRDAADALQRQRLSPVEVEFVTDLRRLGLPFTGWP